MTMSPISKAVLNVLFSVGPCTPDELRKHLPNVATSAISKACNNLKSSKYLDFRDVDGKKAWVALGKRPAPAKQATTAIAVQEEDLPAVTPPRQYDVMRAPVWVPPTNTQPHRPGAMDALRVASYGARC
jgi:hypothetical protein